MRAVDAVCGELSTAGVAAGVVLFLPAFDFVDQVYAALAKSSVFVRQHASGASRVMLREQRGASAAASVLADFERAIKEQQHETPSVANVLNMSNGPNASYAAHAS